MARGARRSKQRFGAALEPFMLLRTEVAVSQSSVGRLAQAQITRAFPRILQDLAKMELAGQALEAVRMALPERLPEPHVFDAVISLFERVNDDEAIHRALLVAFMMRLCTSIGFAPHLDACGVCGAIAPAGKAVTFDPKLGAIVCRNCGGASIRLSGETRAHLTACTNDDWHAHASTLSASEVEEADRMLGAFFKLHVAPNSAFAKTGTASKKAKI